MGFIRNSAAFMALQLCAMLLSILSLPLLANRLGVDAFGQVMLSHALAMIVVVFIDAGFNQESQRQVTMDASPHNIWLQCLVNIRVRSRYALLGTLIFWVLAGFFSPVSWLVLFGASTLILGTLILPQWWWIATQQSVALGFALVLARVVVVCFLSGVIDVHSPVWLASMILALGNVLAGLLLMPLLYRYRQSIDRITIAHEQLQYHGTVKPILLSAGVANMSSQWPSIVLGQWVGVSSVALFASADRLTRAASYLGQYVHQFIFQQLGRRLAVADVRYTQLLLTTWSIWALLCVVGSVVLWYLGPWLMGQLYPSLYASAVTLLQYLGIWLGLYMVRGGIFLWGFSLMSWLQPLAKLQWLEVLSTIALVSVSVYWAGALGAVVGMIAVESLLIVVSIFVWWRLHQQSTRRSIT